MYLALKAEVDRKIHICSHSKSVLQALSYYTTKSRQLKDCFKALNNLANINKLTLMWVQGHRGEKGSITADDLARLGFKFAPPPKPTVRICESIIKRRLRDWILEAHNWECEVAEGCRQTNPSLTPQTLNNGFRQKEDEGTCAKSCQKLAVSHATRSRKQLCVSYVTSRPSKKNGIAN